MYVQRHRDILTSPASMGVHGCGISRLAHAIVVSFRKCSRGAESTKPKLMVAGLPLWVCNPGSHDSRIVWLDVGRWNERKSLDLIRHFAAVGKEETIRNQRFIAGDLCRAGERKKKSSNNFIKGSADPISDIGPNCDAKCPLF